MQLSKELIKYNLELLQSSNIEIKDIPKAMQLIESLKGILNPAVEEKEEGLDELFKD